MEYIGEHVAGDIIPYFDYFHNDTGTLENPNPVSARHRTPAGVWSDLTAPAIEDAQTGLYGGLVDTTGFANGLHIVGMKGVVTSAKSQGKTICFKISPRTAANLPTLAEQLAGGLALDSTVAKDALVESHVTAAIQAMASTYTRSDVSVLADGTEQTLYENAAPADNWIPDNINIDLSVMQAGDALTVRFYVKQKSGGVYRLYDTQNYSGVQTVNGISVRGLANRYGMKITVEQTAGTYRTFEAEVMVIA